MQMHRPASTARRPVRDGRLLVMRAASSRAARIGTADTEFFARRLHRARRGRTRRRRRAQRESQPARVRPRRLQRRDGGRRMARAARPVLRGGRRRRVLPANRAAASTRDFVDNDGSEIEQDLRLRIVPIAFTIRVLPLGQSSAVQPYFGAGLGIFNWRYSESGEFVDFGPAADDLPRAVRGIRKRDRSRRAWRHPLRRSIRSAPASRCGTRARTPTLGSEFAVADEPRIDLGGWTYQFTIGCRFGGDRHGLRFGLRASGFVMAPGRASDPP